MIRITDNLPQALADLDVLSSRHGPFILRRAINATATAVARVGNDAIRATFDRPLARTATAVKVFKGVAREDQQRGDMTAIVGIHDGDQRMAATDPRVLASGKSSIFPNRYLSAQIEGGARVNKRFEVALVRAGIMPAGQQAVFAKRSGYLDPHGNLSAALIVKILSWFKAFPEVGYRANMTDAARQRAMVGRMDRKTGQRRFGAGKTDAARRYGYAYFLSRGERFGGLGMRLPPGIWERNYPNGAAGKSFIKPVLLFVKPARYRVRFPFYEVMQRAIADAAPRELAAAGDLALRTAR